MYLPTHRKVTLDTLEEQVYMGADLSSASILCILRVVPDDVDDRLAVLSVIGRLDGSTKVSRHLLETIANSQDGDLVDGLVKDGRIDSGRILVVDRVRGTGEDDAWVDRWVRAFPSNGS